jgi:hypothetical protein
MLYTIIYLWTSNCHPTWTHYTDSEHKIMIFFFLNNKYILFKYHILIALNLQSQTAISTIRQRRKG